MFDTEQHTRITSIPAADVGTGKRPSARYLRQQRREQEQCRVVLDSIFTSRSQLELDHRLRENVWATPQFNRQAKFRRSYVEGYMRGVQDTVLRQQGRLPAIESSSTPDWVQDLQPDAQWHRHANGGGWVSSTAYVAPTVYVGPKCAVFDSARASDDVRLLGKSRLCDQAEMSGWAVARGESVVGGRSSLSGRAQVSGSAVIGGDVMLDAGVIKNVMLAHQQPRSRRPAHTILPPAPI